MLDLGFPLAALKGIGLLCRTGGLIAHLTEEAERPIGFILSGAAAAAIEYDGPASPAASTDGGGFGRCCDAGGSLSTLRRLRHWTEQARVHYQPRAQ